MNDNHNNAVEISSQVAERTLEHAHMINSQYGSLRELSPTAAENTARLLNAGMIDLGLLRHLTTATVKDEKVSSSVPTKIVEIQTSTENSDSGGRQQTSLTKKSKKKHLKKSKHSKASKKVKQMPEERSGALLEGKGSMGDSIGASVSSMVEAVSRGFGQDAGDDEQGGGRGSSATTPQSADLGNSSDRALKFSIDLVSSDDSSDAVGRLKPEKSVIHKPRSDSANKDSQDQASLDAGLGRFPDSPEKPDNETHSHFKKDLVVETTALAEEAALWEKVQLHEDEGIGRGDRVAKDFSGQFNKDGDPDHADATETATVSPSPHMPIDGIDPASHGLEAEKFDISSERSVPPRDEDQSDRVPCHQTTLETIGGHDTHVDTGKANGEAGVVFFIDNSASKERNTLQGSATNVHINEEPRDNAQSDDWKMVVRTNPKKKQVAQVNTTAKDNNSSASMKNIERQQRSDGPKNNSLTHPSGQYTRKSVKASQARIADQNRITFGQGKSSGTAVLPTLGEQSSLQEDVAKIIEYQQVMPTSSGRDDIAQSKSSEVEVHSSELDQINPMESCMGTIDHDEGIPMSFSHSDVDQRKSSGVDVQSAESEEQRSGEDATSVAEACRDMPTSSTLSDDLSAGMQRRPSHDFDSEAETIRENHDQDSAQSISGHKIDSSIRVSPVFVHSDPDYRPLTPVHLSNESPASVEGDREIDDDVHHPHPEVTEVNNEQVSSYKQVSPNIAPKKQSLDHQNHPSSIGVHSINGIQTFNTRGLIWTYRSLEPKVEQDLNDAGIRRFEKPPTYFHEQPVDCRWRKSSKELYPAIVSQMTTGYSQAVIEFDGEKVYIVSHLNPWPDIRSFESHPDFLIPPRLAEYQACEVAGYEVWRHDRDLLECHKRDCSAMVSDADPTSIICAGCGPKTRIRYCTAQHQIDDLKYHWHHCGDSVFILKRVIDHNTEPIEFTYMCPAIKELHNHRSFALHRQRLYSMFTQGHYTLFDPYTKRPLTLSWPQAHSQWQEMEQRIERMLNIAFFDILKYSTLRYLYLLLRHLASMTYFPDSQAETGVSPVVVLQHQFEEEFGKGTFKVNNGLDSSRPCECEWFGTSMGRRQHVQNCKWRQVEGSQWHSERGSGLWKDVAAMEGNHWILRAWAQQHPSVGAWGERVAGYGYPAPVSGQECKLGPGWVGWGADEDNLCD